MRVEANVSLRPRGTEPFGTRVEVKNMNSFRVRRARDRLRDRAPGGRPRRRRDAHPGDPRLGRGPRRDVRDAVQGGLARLPLFPGAGPAAAARRAAWLDEIRAGLPELPAARRARYAPMFGLSAYDAAVLVGRPGRDGLFEARPGRGPGRSRPRPSRTGSRGEFLGLLRSRDSDARAASSAAGARATHRGGSRPGSSISRTNAQAKCSTPHAGTGDAVAAIIETRGLPPDLRCGALATVVDEVIAANPGAVEDYRAGKPRHRLLRRPGDEGDPRSGECGSGPGGHPRAARRSDGRVSIINVLLWGAGIVLIAVGYHAGAGPVESLPGPQGSGREHRPLRGVARRRPGRRHRPVRRLR